MAIGTHDDQVDTFLESNIGYDFIGTFAFPDEPSARPGRFLAQAVELSNVNLPAGHFSRQDKEFLVEAGPFLKSAGEVANLLVGLNQGKPGGLEDVAQVIDGPVGWPGLSSSGSLPPPCSPWWWCR